MSKILWKPKPEELELISNLRNSTGIEQDTKEHNLRRSKQYRKQSYH